MLARQGYAPGLNVLDIGCGFGDSTIGIAKLVGSKGKVVGIDCAKNFIAACREDAASAGVDNATFVVADVAVDDLGGSYDEAFSRFGTMFFNLPGAAMNNVRKSLKSGVWCTPAVAFSLIRGICAAVQEAATYSIWCHSLKQTKWCQLLRDKMLVSANYGHTIPPLTT